MVCQVQPRAEVHPSHVPVEAPSPQRIRQLTAAIRKTWSPQVRASRAVQGRKPVEIMLVSTRDAFDGRRT
jgi:hypothetical protein